jgi:transposase
MAYSEDLRDRVRKYVTSGGSVTEARQIFGVGRTTIYAWLNNLEPRKKPGRTKPDKIDEEALRQDVMHYPDKLLRERAETFNMSINGIWVAMKRLHIKKNAKIS